MQIVSVCHLCRKTIDTSFIFCPWCGSSVQHTQSTSAIIDTTCQHLTEVQKKGCKMRISKMENSLEQLEKDLTVLLQNHEGY